MDRRAASRGRNERLHRTAALAARIIAAVAGGYALAALVSVAALALPISKPQAALTGQLASFAAYAGAVIWVFAARSAVRAWLGVAAAAAVLAPLAWWVS